MRIILLTLVAFILSACTEDPSTTLLEQIQKKGELIVISKIGPTTYYKTPEGIQGLEYELSSRFAKHLGVRLKILLAENNEDIIPMVVRGKAHLAAAGLAITENRKKLVRFSPSYQTIDQKLVYRLGSKRPQSLEDIMDGHLEVTRGSNHTERLNELTKTHPDLQWKEHRNISSTELLSLVYEQVIDYTIADSNELSLFNRYNKEVNAAFSIDEPQPLAWAMPYQVDNSLLNESKNFFRKLKKSGELDQLIERYYGNTDQLNFVGTRLYIRHVKTKLPRYQHQFEKAAKKYNLDWRLLAAIGYQESHWVPKATSPTGVRGMMMLTLNTAKQLNITNRLDPEQSIEGGAKYLRYILGRLPDRIAEPDRTWLALAAYNVGFYHLKDARILTQKRGADPDKWIEVKKDLPLLSQKKWYKQTKYGYARGNEPVKYVDNIRIYHDLLIWDDNKATALKQTPVLTLHELDSSAF
ncbi:MAG: membrane-bound lytic murein transglycosylase MltF [Gammaproteobacteria bacterium]|nr:membrane-bound lytic murein transglycosylase MltF [Gammaproteobacteria bacterium]